MILLICIKPHGFAGRSLKAGQYYEAAPQFARALVLSGLSRIAPPEALPPAPRRVPVAYETHEQRAEPVAPEKTSETTVEKPARRKRIYKRRDANPVD